MSQRALADIYNRVATIGRALDTVPLPLFAMPLDYVNRRHNQSD
jgi:hypothetical protein